METENGAQWKLIVAAEVKSESAKGIMRLLKIPQNQRTKMDHMSDQVMPAHFSEIRIFYHLQKRNA